ncbi:SRPBCC domain-containing protein [Nocardia callitridis]|uniref:Metalloregulator ArsR/SmtB family transcription factor n=1 Tax=Nocardia callitridis TaxID=648753 RepID=A0ABP9KQX4_9NOCA
MHTTAAALGDAARWRIIELLATRPRSVGELAELTGLRQPQATKHLQTLAREGLVTVSPLGQRRIAALEAAPLRAFDHRLRALLATAEANEGERDTISRYRAALAAESAAAQQDSWADGRTFSFDREFSSTPDTVWRYWTEPDLLAAWWAPSSMTVTECLLEPTPGGRAILEYRDAEGRYRSEGAVRVATRPERLVFELTVLDAAGAAFFTGHYDLILREDGAGTSLRLDLRITETTVAAVPYIAGIATGWGQVLDNLAAALAEPAPECQNATNPTQNKGAKS